MPSFEAVEGDPFAAPPPSSSYAPTPTGESGKPIPRLTVGAGGVEPKLEPVDHDPFATDYAGTAADVAKSGGIGVVKGGIGIAGFPADVAKALGNARDKYLTNPIAKAIGAEPLPEGGADPADYIGSHAIQSAIEKNVTGEFYKPQTTAGKYAETVGEFVPAALAGPGGIVRKLAIGAAVPGIASEAAGQATAGTPAEPYARAGAAIAAGAGAAALARPSSATAALQGRLPAGITQATVDDARKLMIDAKGRGIDLSWPEALSQVAGKPVLSDTQRILESAPSSRTRMQDFYGNRPQQFDQAALNEFGQIAPGTANPSQIGPQVGRAANEVTGDVRKAISAASDPYYKGAEAVLLTPQEMMLVRQIPGWKEARNAVRNSAQLNSYVAHLPDNSVGFLNEVKKYFHAQSENAGSKFNQAKNQQVAAAYDKAESAVKQIGELKSGDYQTALAIERTARDQFLQPLLDGPLGRLAKKDVTTQKAIGALFPSNPLPNSHNEIATTVGALAAKNPGAATQLVRAHLESTFNEATRSLVGGPSQTGAAGFAKAIAGNPQQRANLQAAIESLPNGKQLWSGFDGFLEAAQATGTRQGKGSLTAFNAAELKGLSGSTGLGEAAKTALSPGKWWSVVNDKWGQWKLGQNLDELARILTDPKSAPVLKRIAAMPSGGREAGYLVSRLILQGTDAALKPGKSNGQ